MANLRQPALTASNMGILSDTTNVNASKDKATSQTTKTFARRSKSASEKVDASAFAFASASANQQESVKAIPIPQTARSPDLLQRTSNSNGTSPASQTSDSQASNGTTVADSPETQRIADGATYSWLRLRNHRRSSVMIMPSTLPHLGVLQLGLVGLAQQQAALQQRAKIAARQRVLTIQEIMEQLVGYYQEVDAFELVEETIDEVNDVESSKPKGGKNNSKAKSKTAHSRQQQQGTEKQQTLIDTEAEDVSQQRNARQSRLSAALPNRTSIAGSRRQRYSNLAPIPGSPTHEEEVPDAGVDEQEEQACSHAQLLYGQQQQQSYCGRPSLRNSRASARMSTLPSMFVTENDEEGEEQARSAMASNPIPVRPDHEVHADQQPGAVASQDSPERHTTIQNVESAAVIALPETSDKLSTGLSLADSNHLEHNATGAGTAEHAAPAEAVARHRSTRKSSMSTVCAAAPGPGAVAIYKKIAQSPPVPTVQDTGTPAAQTLQDAEEAVLVSPENAAAALGKSQPDLKQQTKQEAQVCFMPTSDEPDIKDEIKDQQSTADDEAAAELDNDDLIVPDDDDLVQVVSPAPPLSGVQQLLAICGQPDDEALIPSMHDLIASLADIRSVAKVGEGSFGEVFRYKKTVFKVLPLEGDQHMNGAPQRRASEVAAEALMALALSRLREADSDNVTNGFVNTQQVALCHGPYAPSLVKAWQAWDKKHGSENDPVDVLRSPQQLFLVLAMEECGKDLEKADVKSFEQARSLLAQVVFALAVAESAYEFEHRDLHWGNILLRPCLKPHLQCKLQGQNISIASHGVEVSLIDFTASRLRNPNGMVVFCDLSQDHELFQGPAKHVQSDTYRWMQQLTGDDWSAPCLGTNSLWVAYLAEIVCTHKCSTFSASQKRALRDFRKRAMKTPSCQELVHDAFLQDLWQNVEL